MSKSSLADGRVGELECCEVFRGERPLALAQVGVNDMVWLEDESWNGAKGKPWCPLWSLWLLGSSKI